MAQPTHTTSVEHAPATEHKGSFPPFDAQSFPSQLVWLVLTFVVLYTAVSRMVLPRIGSILADRRQRVEEDLASAETLKGQSDAAIAAYEKALAEARGRAQAIATETRDRQAAEADKARHALEAQLNAKLADAEKTIAATREAAMSNVRSIAADAAVSIVQRLAGVQPSADEAAAAVADVLKR